MAETSGFFNATKLSDGSYDRVYLAETFARYFATFIGNGVFGGKMNELYVTAGTGLNVVVSTGQAWINGYWYQNDIAFPIALNVVSAARTDSVVLQLDLNNRNCSIIVLSGSSTTQPNLTRNNQIYQLRLCNIALTSGQTSVSQTNISDTRLDSTQCGLVHGVVDQLDTTSYGTQLNNFIQTYITNANNLYNNTFLPSIESVQDLAQTAYDDFQTWVTNNTGTAETQINALVTGVQTAATTATTTVEGIATDAQDQVDTLKTDMEGWITTAEDDLSTWINTTKTDATAEIQDLVDQLQGLLDNDTVGEINNRLNMLEAWGVPNLLGTITHNFGMRPRVWLYEVDSTNTDGARTRINVGVQIPDLNTVTLYSQAIYGTPTAITADPTNDHQWIVTLPAGTKSLVVELVTAGVSETAFDALSGTVSNLTTTVQNNFDELSGDITTAQSAIQQNVDTLAITVNSNYTDLDTRTKANATATALVQTNLDTAVGALQAADTANYNDLNAKASANSILVHQKLDVPTHPELTAGFVYQNEDGTVTLSEGGGGGGSTDFLYTIVMDNGSDSNPAAITYADDCATFVPGAFNGFDLDLGSWGNTVLYNEYFKPCVIRPTDPIEEPNYFLYRNDYTRKEDGVTPSVLTGGDGDVMIQIKKLYYKFQTSGTNLIISLSNNKPDSTWACFNDFEGAERDFIYLGCYGPIVQSNVLRSISGAGAYNWNTLANSRIYAANRGTGYCNLPYWTHSLYRLMAILMFKTRDIQRTLGQANIYYQVGALNSYNFTSGKGNSNNSPSKFLGIEGFYGTFYNQADFIVDLGTNYRLTRYVSRTREANSNNYEIVIPKQLGNISSAYIKSVIGTNDTLFIPKTASGASDSTFFTDETVHNNNTTTERRISVSGGNGEGFGGGPLFFDNFRSISEYADNDGSRLTRVF